MTSDSAEYILAKQRLLDNLPGWRSVHTRWYRRMLEARLYYSDVQGEEIELGAGASFFKLYHPHVVTTDIIPSRGIDQVLNAEDMPLSRDSVACFYSLNSYHHFEEPRCFFKEIQRVLKDDGLCVMVEPYPSPLLHLIHGLSGDAYRFDKGAVSWGRRGAGDASSVNTALPYLTFVRDKQLWNDEFPQLSIVYCAPLPDWLSSLVLGAMGGRQLLHVFWVI